MKSPIYPDVEMKQINRFGITIDYCPKSGGVWLDKGEIEKLVEYVKNESNKNEDYQEEDNMPFGDSDIKTNKTQNPQKKERENPIMEIFDGFFGG